MLLRASILCSHVNKLGNTGYKAPPHSSTAQETPSQKGKSVAGINLFVDDLSGTSGNEMEQRVLTRLRKDSQVGSED